MDWVRSGAPFGPPQAPDSEVVSLEITPRLITFAAGETHRLLATAHMADGSQEDFTHEVVYQANNTDVAKVSADGVVSGTRLGETSVLVRGAGHTANTIVGVISPLAADYPRVPRANFIDEHVFSKLRRLQILPSDLSSDGEFLRRVCLDLTGTLPPPERVREFLASKDPKKREKLIDTIIATPEFVDYWTFRFSDLFRVSVFANGLSLKWSDMYWSSIRDSVASNQPYDQMARDRLVGKGFPKPLLHTVRGAGYSLRAPG